MHRVTVQDKNSHPDNIINSEGRTRTSPALTDKYPDNRIKAKVLQPNRTKRYKSVMERWRELDSQNRKVINFIGYKPGTGDMIVVKPSYSSSPQPGTGDIIIPNNTTNCK